MGGRIIVQQEKNLEGRTQLDEPDPCTSGDDLLFHYKFLHLLFFPLVRILCALRLRFEKYCQHGLDARPLEFQFFFSAEWSSHQPIQNPAHCFSVICEVPGPFLVKIFLNFFLHRPSR